jgi:hypothetical protein
MSYQKVEVGRAHVLLPVVLRAIHSTVCLILHEQPHELILSGQQLLDVDRRTRWRWRWVGMWGLPPTMPTAYGFLRDVMQDILSGSSSHHLS